MNQAELRDWFVLGGEERGGSGKFWVSSLVKGSARILPKKEDAGDLGAGGLTESQWDQ